LDIFVPGTLRATPPSGVYPCVERTFLVQQYHLLDMMALPLFRLRQETAAALRRESRRSILLQPHDPLASS